MNMVNMIIDLEQGTLSSENVLKLFSHLIRKDLINGLQGMYGRTADALINRGYLDSSGRILRKV